MPNIDEISVTIETGDQSGAGTDGDVYLGICGREFYLDTKVDDFERNSSRKYLLGQRSNTLNADKNDPRLPQMLVEELDQFPVYIRFNPKSRDDNWLLRRVVIFINEIEPGSVPPLYDSSPEPGGIWMGVRSSLFFFPRKHIFVPRGLGEESTPR
jgi:hypothetical protein